jgi:hypothetical protein
MLEEDINYPNSNTVNFTTDFTKINGGIHDDGTIKKIGSVLLLDTPYGKSALDMNVIEAIHLYINYEKEEYYNLVKGFYDGDNSFTCIDIIAIFNNEKEEKNIINCRAKYHGNFSFMKTIAKEIKRLFPTVIIKNSYSDLN